MGIETAILGLGAKVIGGAIAGKSAKKGAKEKQATVNQSADLQRGIFQENRKQMFDATDKLEQDAMALAEADPRELADLEQSYAQTEKQLAREERFLAAIDPSLMEASQQTLKLLRGEEADVNKPMNALRNKQRNQLVASLRSQYGPGAELSSVGRQSLQDFDMQTSGMAAQNQQTSLAQMFGIATQDVMGGMRQTGGQLASVAGSLAQGRMGQKSRALEARLGVGNTRLNAMSNLTGQQIQMEAGIGNSLAGVAGAGQVGNAMTGNLISGLGGQFLGAGLGGDNPLGGIASGIGSTFGSIFGKKPGIVGDQSGGFTEAGMRGGGAGFMV